MQPRPSSPIHQAIARGDLASAEDLARAHVHAQAGDPSALALLGHVLRRRQQDDEAQDLLRQAVQREPRLGAAWKDLAIICLRRNQPEQALVAASEAARRLPDDPWNHFLLGHALALAGRFDASEAAFHRAMQRGGPAMAAARVALSHDAAARVDKEGALFHARAASRLLSQDAAAWHALGAALSALGRHEEALAPLRRACALAPDNAEFLQTLGRLLELLNHLDDELIAVYRRAAELQPTSVPALKALGLAQVGAHQPEAARETFAQLARLAPGHLLARWIDFQLAPRPWFDSEDERDDFFRQWQQGLADFEAADLSDPRLAEEARSVLGSVPNFGLAYLGGAHVDLHRRVAAVLRRLLQAATGSPLQDAPIRPIGQRRRRIAVVSRCLRRHSVTRAWAQNLLALPRDAFELCVIYSDRMEDEVTARFRARADRFAGGRRDYFAWATVLREWQPDVVIFLDIGMDVVSQALALVRFAPVQIATWAHPVTTGMPTIDYFLSSDLAEPADGEAHYSERLVRLPHLGGSFERPAPGPRAAPGAANPHFVCAQFLIKLHPRHDALFASIAQAAPTARFTLLTNGEPHQTAAFSARLHRHLKQAAVDPARFRILPRLDVDTYRTELSSADVVLDSLDFSGGITTLDTLWQERPLVTLPGGLMRGRQSFAMLQRLGLTDTVASDEHAYVQLAAELARNPDWRHAIGAELAARKDALFDDPAPPAALAAFLGTVEHPDCA